MFPIKDTIGSLRKPYMTLAIIIANIAVFLFELIVSRTDVTVGMQLWNGLDAFIFRFGMISARFTNTDYMQVYGRAFSGSLAAIFTAFTAMFIHSGWLHIVGNLWALWIFGDNVEDRMGHWRFLVFYLIAGLAGNLMFLASSPFSKIPLIGASGAIAGVMGAYLILFPYAKVRTFILLFIFPVLIDIPAPIFLGIWFFLQFFNSATSMVQQTTGSDVAYWAHIGGFLFGMLVYRWFLLKERLVSAA